MFLHQKGKIFFCTSCLEFTALTTDFDPSFHINNDFIYIKNLRDNSNILFVLNVKLTGKSLPVYVQDVYPAKDFFLQKYKFSVYISMQKQTSTNERIKTETLYFFLICISFIFFRTWCPKQAVRYSSQKYCTKHSWWNWFWYELL